MGLAAGSVQTQTPAALFECFLLTKNRLHIIHCWVGGITAVTLSVHPMQIREATQAEPTSRPLACIASSAGPA